MDIIAKTIIKQIISLDPFILSALRAKFIGSLPESPTYEGGIDMKITSELADRVRIGLTWADEYYIIFYQNNKIEKTFANAHFPDLPGVLRWALTEDI